MARASSPGIAAQPAVVEVGAPNLKIMFDRYHVETAHGDAAALLRRHQDHIGHIQIASTPDRSTLDADTLAFVTDCSMAGWALPFGCEYRPGADEIITPPVF